jgi:hypothetical protein
MINYSVWPTKKLKVTSLRLDVDNPRLSDGSSTKSQSQIIDYLLQNEKVYELAKDIISLGYFLNERPIVVKEKNKFHVLEGNRRVAACKILINPDLIKSSAKRNTIKKLLKNFDLSIIEKLNVIVAPSREDADVMIVNRHTGGSAVEKWDKTKQDRFLYNRFSAGETVEQMSDKFPLTKAEIKDSLKRYNVYKEISNLDLESTIISAVKDETKFNMTNVERVYQNEQGLEFLGFEFGNNFSIKKKLPKDEFVKRFGRIVEDVVSNKINSRVLNKSEDTDKYINGLRQLSDFDTTIEPNIKYNDGYEGETVEETAEDELTDEAKPKRPRASSVKLFPSSLHLVTGVERIDSIFSELKTLNLKKHPNSVAVLFRSYLDMITYQFLKKKGGLQSLKDVEIERLRKEADKKFSKAKKEMVALGIDVDDYDEKELKKAIGIKTIHDSKKIPSLKYMLVHMVKSDLITDGKLRQALEGYLGTNTKLLGHNEYNLLVHNEYFTTDPEELKLVWEQMQSLLEFLIAEIK